MRHATQVCVLLLFLFIGLMAPIGGVVLGESLFFGTLSSSTIANMVVLTDPFALLEVIAASRAVPVALLGGALITTVFYALVRGRAFCGWVCPLGLFIEIANWTGERTGLRKQKMLVSQKPRYGKIIATVLVLLLCALAGFPVFELISPIAALPRLFVLGVGLGLALFIAIVLLELFFPDRLWCNSLCPVGGFYEAIGYIGFVGVKNHEGCIQCDACKEVCLADKRILDEVVAGTKTVVSAGDCMICGKCIEVCPVGTLTWHLGPAFWQPPLKPQDDDNKESKGEA